MIHEFVKNTCHLDASSTMYPCTLKGFTHGKEKFAAATSTYFGFVLNGKYELQCGDRPFASLQSGMYFAAPGPVTLSGEGEIVVIEKIGYRGLIQVGGPIEAKGRLCYIDNCSTTMIVPPARLGDPVFNALYFPPNVKQTMHIHPTLRLGVVTAGAGECVRPNQTPIALVPGVAFYLAEGMAHCFNSSAQGLTIIAFHPDSDTGPTDGSHPMLNRTYTKF